MYPLLSIVDILVLLSFLLALRTVRDYRRRGGLPYPPGPRPLPIVGNLFHVPTKFTWLAYTRFAKDYGDVLCFHVLGRVIVVLNSVKVTKDLLEKNGDVYSDRAAIPFFQMIGWHWFLPTSRSDDRWRVGRRILDRGLRPGAAATYRHMQEARTHVLLSRLLAHPQEWVAHVELFQGEMILAMTYGYEADERLDKMIDAATEMSNFAVPKVVPGALLVNEIPFLRHIPEWLPWFSYKPLTRIGHEIGNQVLYPPIQFVKESILNGTARPSIALENFQEMEDLKLIESDRGKAEEAVAGALGSIYAAGADTTVSAMLSFVLAMLHYPDVQRKAQIELDSVVGRERLPTFEDRPRLPLIDALCKEVMRWRPVTPLDLHNPIEAIPHATTKDSVYEGFFIPKDAIVFGNTWAILHDPALYPEPDVFKPERFLNSDGSLRDDPILTSAFGFGKRICPGRHFVDATLFIVIASLLSVFNIEQARDTEDLPSDYAYTGFLISRPEPFPVSIVPRDKRAEELILADTMAR